MGKSTISMAIFNGYVNLPEGIEISRIIHQDETNRQRSEILSIGLAI
jgi:hypothetical protein